MNRVPIHRPISWFAAAGAALCLAACEPDPDSGLADRPEILATEPLSRRLETFAGSHAKLVWLKQRGGGKPDINANRDDFELWGVDTRDGLGPRKILADPSNYARPLISPSGDHIVFTHKGSHEKPGSDLKHFDPVVFRVDFDGQHLEKLAEGYATDVWRDPETSVEWVYVTDLEPSERGTLFATRLERFKLLDPGDRERVWDRTRLTPENIQLSRDGTRASGLFPWPDAGVMDPAAQTHLKYQNGCWPSMAPDDSHLAWVFDGSHKNLHLFTDQARQKWVVPVNRAPGVDGNEVYHPRWSNHVRFFSLTGPYLGESIGQSEAEPVEVHLGRFAADFKSVEAWLRVTEDRKADFFPDLWVKTSELRPAPAKPGSAKAAPSPASPAEGREWPVTQLPLLFLWEDGTAANLAGDGAGRACSVVARERARFGPRFEMRVDGGRFEADPASSSAVADHFARAAAPFTLEILATPDRDLQDGVVVGSEHFQVKQRGADWVFVTDQPIRAQRWIGTARAGEAHHLAVAFDGAEYAVFHNGKAVAPGTRDLAGIEMLAGRRGLTFGSGWDGGIEAVSLAPGRLDDSRLEASWTYLRKKIAARQPIPRVRMRGRLLEMTADRPVQALDTYPRGLLAYLYQVEEVVEGRYDAATVMVLHWTILDHTPLQGFPRRPGQTYDLLLEPYASHPQLVSERQWNDLLPSLEPYYDVATPPP